MQFYNDSCLFRFLAMTGLLKEVVGGGRLSYSVIVLILNGSLEEKKMLVQLKYSELEFTT